MAARMFCIIFKILGLVLSSFLIPGKEKQLSLLYFFVIQIEIRKIQIVDDYGKGGGKVVWEEKAWKWILDGVLHAHSCIMLLIPHLHSGSFVLHFPTFGLFQV